MTDLGLEHAAFRMVTEYLPAVNWLQPIKEGNIPARNLPLFGRIISYNWII